MPSLRARAQLTRIYLERVGHDPFPHHWNEDGPYIDLVHEHDLSDVEVELFREIALAARDLSRPGPVEVPPPRAY